MSARQESFLPKPIPPCVNCGDASILWIRGGYVCRAHYMEIFEKEAADYCAKHGLETVAKKVVHVRELFGKLKHKTNHLAWMKNPKSPYAAQLAAEVRGRITDRTPGEDDA